MTFSFRFFCPIVTLGYKFSKERDKKKWGKKMGPGPILQEREHSQFEDITAENGAWPHFFFSSNK
jgi:hypothetical protein